MAIAVPDFLKTFFIGKNGKPNPVSIGITIVSLIVGGTVYSRVIHRTVETSEFDLKYDQKIPPSKVRLGGNEDMTYVRENELDAMIQNKLDQYYQQQRDATQTMIDSQNKDLLNQISAMIPERSSVQTDPYLLSRLDDLERKFDKSQKIDPTVTNLANNGSQGGTYLTNGNSTTTPNNPNNPVNQGNNPVLLPNDYNGNGNTPLNSNTYSNEPPKMKVIVDNGTAPKTNVVLNQGDKLNRGYSVVDGLNSGDLIPGILINGAVSSKTNCPVLVQITEEIRDKDNHVLIPKGAKMMGESVPDFNTRQIYIQLNRLILPNREIQIKAMLVNEKLEPGFCSKYVDKTNSAFWKMMGANFVASMFQAFKDVNYYVTDSGLPVKIESDTVNNKALDAGSDALIAYSNRIMADAQAMGAIIFVNPNLKVKILLVENISLEKFTKRR